MSDEREIQEVIERFERDPEGVAGIYLEQKRVIQTLQEHNQALYARLQLILMDDDPEDMH